MPATTAAMNRGCVGAIIDGAVRDIHQISKMNFPVYAQGSSPYDSQNRQRVIAIVITSFGNYCHHEISDLTERRRRHASWVKPSTLRRSSPPYSGCAPLAISPKGTLSLGQRRSRMLAMQRYAMRYARCTRRVTSRRRQPWRMWRVLCRTSRPRRPFTRSLPSHRRSADSG